MRCSQRHDPTIKLRKKSNQLRRSGRGCNFHTQRNIFEILLNLTEIRLYLPFSDWFRTENGTIRLLFLINWKIVNTIWFQFDLIRYRKHFSAFGSKHCYRYLLRLLCRLVWNIADSITHYTILHIKLHIILNCTLNNTSHNGPV